MMKKKCYVLIIPEVFPSYHTHAGQPTDFIAKISRNEKIHTISKNYKLWQRRIDEVNFGLAYISLRKWSGKPYRSRQIEIKQFHFVGMELIQIDKYKTSESHYYDWNIGSGGGILSLEQVANNEGLTLYQFLRWFFPDELANGLHLEGAIIHFTDFRYMKRKY
jgi:hypothetical protein